ncbi:LPXTG cell wall anchor domain-containing protein [Agromyces sp. PvR057]|uniref:LPXTG cell wall anchor domain-containing protein n=1 Tax=Agromyces sp. PvR057 TaxID=3156403 RepID=UPI0033969CD3
MSRQITVRRGGVIAVAAGFLLAGFAATSAVADELPSSPDAYDPVIVVDRTEFVAGAWEGGFTVTGSGFIPNRSGFVTYGRITPDTPSAPAEEFETDAEGDFSVHVDPWGEPASADSPDQAPFVVGAHQPGPGFFVRSDWTPLTITAPLVTEPPTVPPVTPPAETAPAEAPPAAEVAAADDSTAELAETGSDGTIGFAALALIAAGATVLLRRRIAPASL